MPVFTTPYDFLNQFERFLTSTPVGLPYTIKKSKDRMKWVIEIAAAGFSKKEIEISTSNNILTIKGTKKKVDSDGELLDEHDNMIPVAGNLAFRDFEKRFTLGEHVEVSYVSFINGLLQITLEVKLPKEKQPKVYPL